MRRATPTLLKATVVAALLTSCGTDETTTSQESTTDAPTTDAPSSVDPATDAEPVFPESTALQTGENAGEWDLVLTDVRVGEHGSFDRIVLEFRGAGTPGWAVQYLDEAVLDGSGEVVALGGDATLDIYASGTTYPASGYYDGPQQFAPENGGDVADVYVGGTFEGYTQVLAGIDGEPVPFRIFALSDPARLVVDVSSD